MAIISIIAAVAHNGVIGRSGHLPWYLPSDLSRFMCITNDSPIIMGRKTFESIGHSVPERLNIVMTKDQDFIHEGIKVCHSLTDALRTAESAQSEEIFIVGGAKLYRDTIDLAERIYLTSILENYDGDTFFPKIDVSKWHVSFSRYFPEAIPHHFSIIERMDSPQKVTLHAHVGCAEIEQEILGRAIPRSLVLNSQDPAMQEELSKHRRW